MKTNLIQPVPDQDDILQGIARENATVATCVRMWERGACSWEQAMMIAVVMLAAEVEAGRARLVHELEGKIPRPFVFWADDGD